MSENIIKQTCKRLNITQKELAARMGIVETTISQWSRGINPTPQWAINFMQALIDLNTAEIQEIAIDKAIDILQNAKK